MARKPSFSPDETQVIVECVWAVILGAMNADGIGNPVKFIREGKSLDQFFLNARTEYRESKVVQHFLDANAEQQKKDIDPIGIPSLEQIAERLGKIDKLLANSPDEAMAFRNFLYQVAMTVANAYGGGLLGRGEKISERERDFLDMLKTKWKGDMV